MSSIIAVLVGIAVAYFLSSILLRDKSKRKADGLDGLMDDDLTRDKIMEETKDNYYTKNFQPVISEYPTLFRILYKMFLIDLEKNKLLLMRANETKRTADELSVLQLASMVSGFAGLILFYLLGAPIMLCLFIFFIAIYFRFYLTVKYHSKFTKMSKVFKNELPDFLDALRIPIQNGMIPDVAFRKVASEWDGALGKEFQNAILESHNYGGLLYKPLEKLAYKMNYASFTNFTHSFCTALRTGTDMAPYIGSICNEIRIASNNDVLASNRKKETYILFVMMLFIFFPVVFLMVSPMLIKAFG